MGWTLNSTSLTGEIHFFVKGSTGYGSESAWNASRKSSYDSAYSSKYDSEYSNEFQRAYSQIQSNDQSTGESGTIKGTFKTEEYGSAQSAGSQSDWSTAAKSDAKVAAESAWSTDYGAYVARQGTSGASVDVSSESEWEREYNNAYNNEYSRSYATAAAGAARSSDSSVEVNGIGSDANIAVRSTLPFNVEIIKNTSTATSASTDPTLDPISTANGSAAVNLSTSSFANQSQSTTASGFMQAFGGYDGGGSGATVTETGTYTTTATTVLTP